MGRRPAVPIVRAEFSHPPGGRWTNWRHTAASLGPKPAAPLSAAPTVWGDQLLGPSATGRTSVIQHVDFIVLPVELAHGEVHPAALRVLLLARLAFDRFVHQLQVPARLTAILLQGTLAELQALDAGAMGARCEHRDGAQAGVPTWATWVLTVARQGWVGPAESLQVHSEDRGHRQDSQPGGTHTCWPQGEGQARQSRHSGSW